MEEIRENVNPVDNVVPDEVVPGFVAAEDKEKDEKRALEAPEAAEMMPEAKSEENTTCGAGNDTNCKKRCRLFQLLFDLLMAIGLIVLFILHFTGNKPAKVADPVVAEQKGDGSVVYVNIDTINEKYEMVSLLTDSIDAEKQRQTVQFQNRQKALENKLANYQRNMQSGQLTAQQAQYAEASLQQESQKLQSDYAQAVESLEARYTAALEQIADSLREATKRVNAGINASYVFTYGNGSPMIIADPSRDITNQVLEELNKPFSKKKKK